MYIASFLIFIIISPKSFYTNNFQLYIPFQPYNYKSGNSRINLQLDGPSPPVQWRGVDDVMKHYL